MPTIKVNDIHLYYETHGQGEPLVMVVGFSADHFAWASLIDHYKTHYQVIVFDNRGIGQSACPDYPYTIEMMADDTAALCKALNFSSCHFMTNSMGGCIVQTLAYKYPELVRSVVLGNTLTKIDIKFALFAKSKLSCFKNNCGIKANVESFLGWIYSSRYLEQPGIVDGFIRMALANPFPVTEVGYRNQLHALLNFDSTAWISQINTPCLVIGTDQDLIVSEQQTRELAKLIPNAECHIIRDAAHVPFIEKPHEYNERCLAFYQQLV